MGDDPEPGTMTTQKPVSGLKNGLAARHVLTAQ
jgi:hypothetical protein